MYVKVGSWNKGNLYCYDNRARMYNELSVTGTGARIALINDN